MIKLRGYQQTFVDKIRAAWGQHRVVLGVSPTGSGKTVIFSTVVHDHNGAAAVIVHRNELVSQISCALAALDVKHRVIATPKAVTAIRRRHLKQFGRSFVDPSALTGVASVQTLSSAASKRNAPLQQWIGQVSLAVLDEGHHYISEGVWGRTLAAFNKARMLLVTATPERADGKGLGVHADGLADVMVEGPSAAWLIKQGYLSPFVYKAPDTDLDVSGLTTGKSGDFNAKALRARAVESHIVGDVVDKYVQFANGKQAIVFATDVQTAQDIAARFKAAGIAAAEVNGGTDSGERLRALDAFSAASLQVLVNVDLFDEGLDVPGVDCVVLARPTESLGKYLQMVGRALRVVYADGFDLSTGDGRRAAIAAGPKPSALIIDMVRNWERHGMANWPRVWSLDGREGGARGTSDDTIPQRVCPACTQPYERFHPVCPYCGEPPHAPKRRTPDQVDGDLIELDVDGMAALFEQMRRADMPDDEFEQDMIARRIPAVGRGAERKRHREARHRREVLRQLINWWAGAHPPDRSKSEIYRRFYHRFGVDAGTAMTLNTKETDALIERIKERFTDDLH